MIRILAVLLALVYLAFGVVGGIVMGFDSALDRTLWLVFLIVAAGFLFAGVAAGEQSRWVVVGLFAAGGILGTLPLFWAVVAPIAALVLIVLAVLWARREPTAGGG